LSKVVVVVVGTSSLVVLQADSLPKSILDFTLLSKRVPLQNYYQCGFGGMGDRFDPIIPPM
jgi:hypothetical protein